MNPMKTTRFLACAIFAVIAPNSMAADSKHTSEYIIANSADHEGKDVSLDVSFVKPVSWKSPIPGLAFFHAVTIDKRDQKMGGTILVAVDAAESGSFARKYGMDFEDRRDSDSLRGLFLAAPRLGKTSKGSGSVWFVDTTGTAADLIKANQILLEDDAPDLGKGRVFARDRRDVRLRP